MYLYFSSLKKHLSKNHSDYYNQFFNQPSKMEIQSFKKMTSQNIKDLSLDAEAESEEEEDVSRSTPRGKSLFVICNTSLLNLLEPYSFILLACSSN